MDGASFESQALRGVRLRFRLEPGDYVARVRELSRTAGQDAGATEDFLSRLARDDLYLATACLAGEESAWQELATAHFDFLRQFARRFVPADAARDIADAVIADIWERDKLRQYGGRSSLRTWLAAVVAHAALNARPGIERTRPLDTQHAGMTSASAPADDAAAREAASLLARMVKEELRALPAAERSLLLLYYEQSMTLDELAATFGASAPAISRRLKRIRETLLAALEAKSRAACGESAQGLRAGLDLAAIEIDLDKLLGGSLSNDRKEG